MAGVTVMPGSFRLLCWLTGHNELDILGPSAGGTAFLNPNAVCSPPASIAAEWLLRSCPCALPCRLAVRRCPDGQQRARRLPDASLHRWARFLQHRVAILVARGRWEVPGPGLRVCGRTTGIPPWSRLRPAACRGQLQGPCLRRGGGRRARAWWGRLSRWSWSCLAACPPLRPIQVSPSACRGGAACLGSARAQRAGSCQPRGVPGLPRGSGRGAGSCCSWEPALAAGGGRRAWEPLGSPDGAGRAGVAGSGRHPCLPLAGLGGSPRCFQGWVLACTRCVPFCTPRRIPPWAPRALPWCCGG